MNNFNCLKLSVKIPLFVQGFETGSLVSDILFNINIPHFPRVFGVPTVI